MNSLTTLALGLSAVLFLAHSASADVVNAKDGISCLFEPFGENVEGKMALITRDVNEELQWSDYNTPEGMRAWFISSNDSRISFASVGEAGSTRMLTLRSHGAALLTIHTPIRDDELNWSTQTGTCSIFGKGLF